VILSAVYMLWMFQRVNYGEVTNPKNASLPDLTPREWATIGPAVAMAIVMGVFPTVFLAPSEPAVRAIVDRIGAAASQGGPAAAAAPAPGGGHEAGHGAGPAGSEGAHP
jgi:NADH-quinone oxidoreductase subunit M